MCRACVCARLTSSCERARVSGSGPTARETKSRRDGKARRFADGHLSVTLAMGGRAIFAEVMEGKETKLAGHMLEGC